MEFEWDPDKSARNVKERGLPFSAAKRFDWSTAMYYPDDREDYGEERVRMMGRIDGTITVFVYVLRGGALRVISLRKANRIERTIYVTRVG